MIRKNPMCECGLRTRPTKGKTKDGERTFRAKCDVCAGKKTRDERRRLAVGALKKDFCEQCGFKAEHTCQLDIDHIDGNRTNNSPENLQTLCANCHRLKTHLNNDWSGKYSEKRKRSF